MIFKRKQDVVAVVLAGAPPTPGFNTDIPAEILTPNQPSKADQRRSH